MSRDRTMITVPAGRDRDCATVTVTPKLYTGLGQSFVIQCHGLSDTCAPKQVSLQLLVKQVNVFDTSCARKLIFCNRGPCKRLHVDQNFVELTIPQ